MTPAASTGRWLDRAFRVIAGLAAAVPVLVLGAMAVMLTVESIPTLRYMGVRFFTGTVWDLGNLYGATTVVHGVQAPVGANYGALPFIVGTFASSVIALILTVPISLRIAALLAYRIGGPLKAVVSTAVDLLAGIPSVVLGLWGITVLVPWVANSAGPWIAQLGRIIPWLGGPVGTGMGLFSASLVLALMMTPILTATVRELLEQVPVSVREAGLGVGMTSWEVVRRISLPAVRTGLVGAVALAWGRALGETMAVLMVGGSAANYLPHNVFSPISTMAATIAEQLDSALTDASGMALHALSELAWTLIILTVTTNALARLLVARGGMVRRHSGRRLRREEESPWTNAQSA